MINSLTNKLSKVLVILGLSLFLFGCVPPVKSPIKVKDKYYSITQSGVPVCSLELELTAEGRGAIWTDYSSENCNYNKGDILK